MAELVAVNITVDGKNISGDFTPAAAGGDSTAHHPQNVLIIKNANVSTARTLTLDNFLACGHDPDTSIHDEVITIPASGEVMIDLAPIRFKDTSDGLVKWTYDVETDLTVGVFRRAAKSS